MNPGSARPPICVNLLIIIIIFSKKRISLVKPPGHQIKERYCHSWTMFSSQLAWKGDSRQCPGNCLTQQQSIKERKRILQTDFLKSLPLLLYFSVFLRTFCEWCQSPRGHPWYALCKNYWPCEFREFFYKWKQKILVHSTGFLKKKKKTIYLYFIIIISISQIYWQSTWSIFNLQFDVSHLPGHCKITLDQVLN